MELRLIPGSVNLYIDLNNNIYNKNKEKLEIPIKMNKILINIFNQNMELDIEWLKLVTWYDVSPEFMLLHHNKIKFASIRNTMLKKKVDKVMVFTEPIFYCHGFRYIPCYTRYAINKNGEVFDTLNKRFCPVYQYQRMYKHVSIYDGLIKRVTPAVHHRLVALTFIPNDDFITRPYINHIDADRGNNEIGNLEWCSPEENAVHAAKMGLQPDILRVKARDVYTGKITHHYSLQDIVTTFGIPYTRLSFFRVNYGRLPGYLFNKRYEIKLEDDNTPWYYENKDLDESCFGEKAYITWTIFNKNNGETKVFNSGKALCKKYQLWLPIFNKENIIKAMKVKHPNLEVSYKINHIRGPYNIYDVVKKKFVFVCSSLRDIEKQTGIGNNMIRDHLSRKEKFIYNDRYIVLAEGNTKFNLDEYVKKPDLSKKVKLIDVDTKEEKIFNSIRGMGIFLGVDKHTANRIYHNKSIYKNYLVRPIT